LPFCAHWQIPAAPALDQQQAASAAGLMLLKIFSAVRDSCACSTLGCPIAASP
jgi:hypothetical protein